MALRAASLPPGQEKHCEVQGQDMARSGLVAHEASPAGNPMSDGCLHSNLAIATEEAPTKVCEAHDWQAADGFETLAAGSPLVFEARETTPPMRGTSVWLDLYVCDEFRLQLSIRLRAGNLLLRRRIGVRLWREIAP